MAFPDQPESSENEQPADSEGVDGEGNSGSGDIVNSPLGEKVWNAGFQGLDFDFDSIETEVTEEELQELRRYYQLARLSVPGSGENAHSTEATFTGLKFHAKGGLGKVFRARDEGLKRDVVLKFIQKPHDKSPEMQKRFLREAEVTGQLDHPGIVPVYGMGQDEDGNPFYVMRYIEGQTLKQAIDEYHADYSFSRPAAGQRLAFQGLLNSFISFCNTIAYAHSKGYMHRDIKPANLMLGTYGETLVLDWGLAKEISEQDFNAGGSPAGSESDTDDETHATSEGAVIGTPAYMSPEQASGEIAKLDQRSDVYSLGATLFTLLTGRSHFKGNRSEVLKNVIRGDSQEPRKVNHRIPAPLGAICRKAMSLGPEVRYQTAKELADEIERWLAAEAVEAYREPWSQWAGRWVRRNMPIATGVACLLVAAVIALVAGNLLMREKNAEILNESTRAEKNFETGLQAIEKSFTSISESTLLEVPGMKPLRDELLRESLKVYQELAGQGSGESAELQMRSARAYGQVARIQLELGSFDEAEADSLKAISSYLELLKATPQDQELYLSLLQSKIFLGAVYSRRNSLSQAIDTLNEAARLLAKGRVSNTIPGRAGREARYLSEEATISLVLGDVYDRQGNRDDAVRNLEKARLLLGTAGRTARFSTQLRSRLSQASVRLARIKYDIGDLDASGEICGGEIEYLKPRMETSFNELELATYAEACLLSALVFIERRLLDKALKSCELSSGAFQRLVNVMPTVPAYRIDWANALLKYAEIYSEENGNPSREITPTLRSAVHRPAEESFQKALGILEGLHLRDPESLVCRTLLARVKVAYGIWLSELDISTTIKFNREAVDLLEGFSEKEDFSVEARLVLAAAYCMRGTHLLQGFGKEDESADLFFRKGLEIYQDIVRLNPDVPRYQMELLNGYGIAFSIAHKDPELAFNYMQKAISRNEGLVQRFPGVPKYKISLEVLYRTVTAFGALHFKRPVAVLPYLERGRKFIEGHEAGIGSPLHLAQGKDLGAVCDQYNHAAFFVLGSRLCMRLEKREDAKAFALKAIQIIKQESLQAIKTELEEQNGNVEGRSEEMVGWRKALRNAYTALLVAVNDTDFRSGISNLKTPVNEEYKLVLRKIILLQNQLLDSWQPGEVPRFVLDDTDLNEFAQFYEADQIFSTAAENWKQAVEACKNAVRIRRLLVARRPVDVVSQKNLAEALKNQSRLVEMGGNLSASILIAEEAVQILESLVKSHFDKNLYAEELLASYESHGRKLYDLGRKEQASEAFSSMIKVAEFCLEKAEKKERYYQFLSKAYSARKYCHADDKQSYAGDLNLQRVFAEKWVEEDSGNPDAFIHLAQTFCSEIYDFPGAFLSSRKEKLKLFDMARQQLSRARAVNLENKSENPFLIQSRGSFIESFELNIDSLRATWYFANKLFPEARECYENLVEDVRRARVTNKLLDSRRYYVPLVRLGELYKDLGREKKDKKLLRRAITLLDEGLSLAEKDLKKPAADLDKLENKVQGALLPWESSGASSPSGTLYSGYFSRARCYEFLVNSKYSLTWVQRFDVKLSVTESAWIQKATSDYKKALRYANGGTLESFLYVAIGGTALQDRKYKEAAVFFLKVLSEEEGVTDGDLVALQRAAQLLNICMNRLASDKEAGAAERAGLFDRWGKGLVNLIRAWMKINPARMTQVVISRFKEGKDYLNARRHPAFQALIKELESVPEPASPREK